jgi:Amt family ammonium transporter
MIGNGAIAGLVAITAPSGYVEFWAAPIIGFVGGAIVVGGVLMFERLRLDDPVGALSAHGLAGIWGTLSCGLFTSDRLAEAVGVGNPGLLYGGGLGQLGSQALAVGATFAAVFILSSLTFWRSRRRSAARLRRAGGAGLDIAEHGMYGYPEQFIPVPPSWRGTVRLPHAACCGARGGARSVRGRSRHEVGQRYLRHESFAPIRSELLELGFPR